MFLHKENLHFQDVGPWLWDSKPFSYRCKDIKARGVGNLVFIDADGFCEPVWEGKRNPNPSKKASKTGLEKKGSDLGGVQGGYDCF